MGEQELIGVQEPKEQELKVSKEKDKWKYNIIVSSKNR